MFFFFFVKNDVDCFRFYPGILEGNPNYITQNVGKYTNTLKNTEIINQWKIKKRNK